MQGTIAFDGTLSGSIAGGGGGGSEVSITPVLTEGEKIADYTIDSESGSLYAPQSGSLVTITPTYIAGEKIADFSIDGVKGKIYTPEIFYIHTIEKEYIENPGDTLLFYYTESDGDRAAIYCPAAQAPLTPGQNITIDVDNVISASGGSGVDYSLTEQDTGLKWVDGRSIYQITFQNSTTLPSNIWTSTGDSLPAGSTAISCEVLCTNDLVPVWFEVGADGHIELLNIRSAGSATLTYYTVRYVKSV